MMSIPLRGRSGDTIFFQYRAELLNVRAKVLRRGGGWIGRDQVDMAQHALEKPGQFVRRNQVVILIGDQRPFKRYAASKTRVGVTGISKLLICFL